MCEVIYHTLLGILQNGGFTALKMHPMFSVHTTLEKFENSTITGYFGFVFDKNSYREIW